MPKKEEVVRLLPPKASGTMRLANVIGGFQKEPYRLVIAGVHGIGKSTFGAAAPDPIFIDAEGGSGRLNVKRYPQPQNFNDVREAIADLTNSTHDRKTLVIDTLDAVEALIWKHVCARDQKFDIEDYGYGKGYVVALDAWRTLLSDLERLERTKGMNIILTGHSLIRTFKNPLGEDYDRFELLIHRQAAGLVNAWVRAVLFARFEVFTDKAKGALKAKGFSTGVRLLFTEQNAAYDAKNRYDLPESIPLSWDTFEAHASAVQTPGKMIERIKALVAGKDAALEKQVEVFLQKSGEDITKLTQLKNWIAQKLAFLAEQQAAAQSLPTNTQSEN